MELSQIQSLRAQYKDELFQSVIPFWLNHSLDTERGGYFACLDRDGTVFDTDKFAWMQGREIFMFLKLCSVYGTRPEWLKAAQLGLDFMRKHGRAENGDFYFSMDRTGKPLVAPYNIFSDCFMCTAFSEYYKVTGEERAKEEALSLYRRIQVRKDNPKGVWTKQLPGARNLCAMALPMIQMMMARELSGVLPERELAPIITQNLDIIRRRHIDHERKMMFERVLPDGGHLFDVMEGRLLNPGHALEVLWFMMDVANGMGRQDIVEEAAEVMLWCVERGWDQKYGGIFYYMDYENRPTEKLESNMKLWWVHAEALCAFLLAYKLLGKKEHLDWFLRLHEYSFSQFSDKEYGEWYGYLTREGEPAFGLKGGKWKGFYHLPRMLMTCEQWLGEMEHDLLLRR